MDADSNPRPVRAAALDPAAIDRLCEQTRRIVCACDDPLLRVHYWVTFLDIFLASGIRGPVYEEDCLSGLVEALSADGPHVYDPLLAIQLRGLLGASAINGNPLVGSVNSMLAKREAESELMPSLLERRNGDVEGLCAGIILVMSARPLWERPTLYGIAEILSVQANRGFVAPGQISWHARLVPGDTIHRAAHDSLAAALRAQGFTRPRLSYEIAVGRPQLPLMGSSLGLALAALMGAYEAAARRKELPVPRPDVVLCGAVDAQGNVLSVAPRTLQQKLRAACGAGFRHFVLPEENAVAATSDLAALGAILPGRELPQLVPVRHLRDIWVAPEVVHLPLPPVRRRVRRRRTFPAALVFVIAFLVVLGAVLLRPRWNDPEKITTRFQDGKFHGVVLRDGDFPPRERVWKFETTLGCAIDADLRPVSRAALLVGTSLDGPDPSKLYCFDIATRRLLWSKDFSHPEGMIPEFYRDNRITVAGVVVGDLDSDGRQDVIVVLHANPNSPCFVTWLLADGTQKAIYGHSGYLIDSRIVDLNQSGHPVVLLTGTLNTRDRPFSQSATLVALDATHFSGWPARGYFSGERGASFDSCLARVVFPPIPEDCAINDVPGYVLKSFAVSPSATDPRIVLAVGRGLQDPGFVITLDGSFQPIRIVPEDGLAVVVARAIAAGRIQADFTSRARLDQYIREIRRLR